MQLITQPVFQIYVVAVIILGLNLLVLANNTALSRVKNKETVNPEDKKLPPNRESEVVYHQGSEPTQRYRRAHANALENIPLFLVTGFLLTLTPVPLVTAGLLFGIFCLFRVLHSIAYLKALQPLRTIAFGIAALDQLAILGFLGYHVFAQ